MTKLSEIVTRHVEACLKELRAAVEAEIEVPFEDLASIAREFATLPSPVEMILHHEHDEVRLEFGDQRERQCWAAFDSETFTCERAIWEHIVREELRRLTARFAAGGIIDV